MFSRYRQGGDVHGDAAIQVERCNHEETPPSHDRSADNNIKVFFQ